MVVSNIVMVELNTYQYKFQNLETGPSSSCTTRKFVYGKSWIFIIKNLVEIKVSFQLYEPVMNLFIKNISL